MDDHSIGMRANEHIDEGDAKIVEGTGSRSEGWTNDHQRHGGSGKFALLWSGKLFHTHLSQILSCHYKMF